MGNELLSARRAAVGLLACAAVAAGGCGGGSKFERVGEVQPQPAPTTTAVRPPSPQALARAALLEQSDLPDNWQAYSEIRRLSGDDLAVVACLPRATPPLAGALGPQFADSASEQRDGTIVQLEQVVELHASEDVAREVMAAFETPRSRRCLVRSFLPWLRDTLRGDVSFSDLHASPLELPALADDRAGLHVCATAFAQNTERRLCNDVVIVRHEHATTTLTINAFGAPDPYRARQFATLAARRLEETL
ncbi:hypothetical protein Q5424_27545 [Conexibacter sp. JD483]|uniref:hypothetical protein n=1 Tax=unclassified Conexibacter TaxID=2627773 RepID=UPI002716AFF2|nr:MULTISPECIES: hypothetical protein [unclassified Conexibacter]MDO8188493.1 hypothetical protein [Conexibacter sp. CPCC 205706]MDO8201431.1 hypothetical protein [Conexibacter sp. CPCC 205762]MDR9372886.1 hypothetical protein [Conexibacter sp. JD483]